MLARKGEKKDGAIVRFLLKEEQKMPRNVVHLMINYIDSLKAVEI